MKFVVWVAFVGLVCALASAAVIPQEDYLPPALEEEQVALEQPVDETAVLADDGYRYKTVRKLRHRRDVSELLASGAESSILAEDGYHYKAPEPTEALEKISNEYLPPKQEASEKNEVSEAPAVSNEYLPPAENEVEAKEVPVVTEAPVIPEEPAAAEETPEILAPAPVSNEYLPPADDSEVIEGPAETAVLADDGYHYRRVRYRRDVSEIVAPASGYLYEAPAAAEEVPKVYLPPAEVKEAAPEPSEEPEVAKEYLPPTEVKEAPEEPEAAPESAVLADDGYRYKTVRRIRYRHRRDVSEIAAPASGYLYEAPVASEEVAKVYLPPAEVKEAAPEPSEEPEVAKEYLPPAEVKEAEPEAIPEAAPESAVLADDGYRYKTVRRIRYRHRRDVSELFAPGLDSAVLAEDGYHYKTPEASELSPKVSNEYLPPAPEDLLPKEAPAEVSEVVPEQPTEAPIVTEAAPVVTEAPATEAPTTTAAPKVSNEYLPPSEEVPELKEASEPVEDSAVLAEDGYHYKVGRRFRFRRDVSELPAVKGGYSYPRPVKQAVEAPVEVPVEVEAPVEVPVEVPAEDSAVLADDGYRYKTVRRIRYRHRRDVSELVAPVEESTVLAADGYHYKKPENELPVPNVLNEYLPPAEAEPLVNEVPEDSEVIEAAAVPEVKEVSNQYLPPAEIKEVSNEYLPPVEAAPLAAEPAEAPIESAALADDGYRYKTVRRIRYRHRRDVSELVAPADDSAVLAADGYHYKKPENELPIPNVANEYLPPAEPLVEVNEVPEDSEVIEAAAVPEVKEVSNQYLPPAEAKEVSNEYLPPVEAAPLAAEAAEAPIESAALADDGYRYKTVRRIRYRHRRDVSELVAPVEESAVLAADGYHYKKPENELPVPSVSNEYLPPAEPVAEINEVPEDSEVIEAAVPEVKEVSNEYLPPAEAKEVSKEYLPPVEAAPLSAEAPAESAALADDGYRYKTVRRIRYRHRRDVSEIVNAAANGYVYEAPAATEPEASEPVAKEAAPVEPVSNEYLPPAEETPEVKEAAPEPTEAAPEVSNEYLPPAEETRGNAEIVEVPQETAVLADDGYRYKTVRRIRYRHRRDVSELVAAEPEPEYLPPAEEAAADLKQAEDGASVLAEDGYRYKTVKRLRK